MDIVTALISMAIGATLVSVLSALISFYKRSAQLQPGDIIVTIKKNGSTIEAINPTDAEIDSLIMILKSIYQGGGNVQKVETTAPANG